MAPAAGIGCIIARDDNGSCLVTKVVQGGAAAFSGQINVGDRIESVDGKLCRTIDSDVISEWFLGEQGTSVALKVRDGLGGMERQVRLVRQPLARVGTYHGEMAGIGAVLALDAASNIVVSKIVYGGAAAQIKPSDLFGEDRLKRLDQIVEVDGRDVRGLTPADLRPMLIGPVGSFVRLKVKRAKYDVPIEVEIRRIASQMQTQFVPLESVSPDAVAPNRKASASASRPSRPVSLFDAARPTSVPSPSAISSNPQGARPVSYKPGRGPELPLANPDDKVGVGLVLRERPDGSHTVKRLKEGQAAERCGQIEIGDLLTHVDGLDIAKGAPAPLLADLIAGPQGTVVNLTFEKANGGLASINLLRGGPDYITKIMSRDPARPRSKPPPPHSFSSMPSKSFTPSQNVAMQRSSSASAAAPKVASGQQAVGVSLSLDQDYDALVNDQEKLSLYNRQLKEDIASAIKVGSHRIQLVGVQRSNGIIVDLNILPDASDGRPVQQLAADLAAQVADPNSFLRHASSTSSVQRADVHSGTVTPPTTASVFVPGSTPPQPVAAPAAAAKDKAAAYDRERAGVGLVLREDDQGRQIVRRLVPGMAAERSGLIVVSDVLTHVNGTSAQGSNVLNLIPGKEGSTVRLSFHRHDLTSKDYQVTLVRGDASYISTLRPPSIPPQQKVFVQQPPQSSQPTGMQPRPESMPVVGNVGDALAKKRASAMAGASGVVPLSSQQPMQQQSTRPGGDAEMRVMVMLKGDMKAGIVPLVVPPTWTELLAAVSAKLNAGEVTRVYTDAGTPITSINEITPGEKLVVHASAKGLFESWSFGLVVKRRFVLRERMGEVGLGQLWKAYDTAAGVEVVLTEEGDETALAVRDAILAERGQGPDSEHRRYREERFLRDMEMVQAVRSEHVCRVVDFGLQQGRMFCVSEFLIGQTLSEALHSRATDGAVLTEPLVRKIGIEILLGLEEAGDVGLTHCNLTPSNVFLSSEGVRVLGLGFAGWDPEVISNASYKLPVKAMPQYMSPEQVSGRLVDPRSDLFSLAVILYRCIVGKLPFDGPVFVNIVQAITSGPTPDVQANSPTTVSDALARIIMTALSKSPDDRYASAREMRLQLEAAR